MFWADPVTGQSAHCWGRALGWYTMALVEVLPFFPENHPGKAELQGILEGILATLPKYADPETGMWYQVLDCPGREGNYLEATCSDGTSIRSDVWSPTPICGPPAKATRCPRPSIRRPSTRPS